MCDYQSANGRVRCTVVNVKHEPYDVRIQRGTKWGNPYRASKYGLDNALQLYKLHLINEIKAGRITKADLQELRGKRLGCGCKPKKCHGDILAYVVNKVFGDLPDLEKICS